MPHDERLSGRDHDRLCYRVTAPDLAPSAGGHKKAPGGSEVGSAGGRVKKMQLGSPSGCEVAGRGMEGGLRGMGEERLDRPGGDDGDEPVLPKTGEVTRGGLDVDVPGSVRDDPEVTSLGTGSIAAEEKVGSARQFARSEGGIAGEGEAHRISLG
jgi:hypothetical protein